MPSRTGRWFFTLYVFAGIAAAFGCIYLRRGNPYLMFRIAVFLWLCWLLSRE
jgi:hypothetical protein